MNSNLLNREFATFQPQGYLSAANAKEFLQQLTEAVETSNNPSILIDMKEVEFMDSAGLMALIEGFRFAQEMKRNVSICSVAPSVRMLFELTQLDNVFNIFDSQDSFVAEAVAA
ncbi:Anti-sigma factor antagonist [Hyella patelloides LEGE 07179]|uniref:Anti-sigma factor antagonist n=1 Tax=Hyella patelloides LEGE 07179 TaxID=945734 RepID=A0A563VYW0_9CYAN|nr:STAS domain-containing protein [Hyella patelloides]VEP16610.1 Anti-sigma factor antagonist [Hyella patelloides LEGE 07179]